MLPRKAEDWHDKSWHGLKNGSLPLSLTEPVQVTVGRGATSKDYTIPKGLLTTFSSYFRSVLDSGRRTASSPRPVSAPESDPHVFDLFVQYLYLGSIEYSELFMPDLLVEKAWILGDKLGAPHFQNYLMKEMIHRRGLLFFGSSGYPITPNTLAYVSKHSGRTKLRSFLCDAVVAQLVGGHFLIKGDEAGWAHLMETDRDLFDVFQAAVHGRSADQRRIADGWSPEQCLQYYIDSPCDQQLKAQWLESLRGKAQEEREFANSVGEEDEEDDDPEGMDEGK